MQILATKIEGVMVVLTQPFADHRGAFTRLFCDQDLARVLGNRGITQINHSRTTVVGALRGLHYQMAPHAELKMIRCLRGRVWDVALDLRRDSATFLSWHAEELTPENAKMLVVPEGCAHGFQVLVPDSELLYLHTASYHQASEGGVRYNDPLAAIDWPLPVSDLSQRDATRAFLPAQFLGI